VIYHRGERHPARHTQLGGHVPQTVLTVRRRDVLRAQGGRMPIVL
jgi:hypothetical protein